MAEAVTTENPRTLKIAILLFLLVLGIVPSLEVSPGVSFFAYCYNEKLD